MNDDISKREAIECLKEECEAGCIDKFSAQQRREIFREAIECIEAIDAKPIKRGKWLGSADTFCGLMCPFCKTPVDYFCGSMDYISLIEAPNYCPNCGARMEGIEE